MAMKNNLLKTYAVFDLETTGVFNKGGRIIQIGIAFIKDNKIIDTFNTFVNPGIDIPTEIINLTGITNAMVKDAPYFEEIIPVLENMLKDCVLVAHNAEFDWDFLNKEFALVNEKPLVNKIIDTVTLSQILLPTAPGYRLSDLTNILAIDLKDAHRAIADAIATAKLFLILKDLYQKLPSDTKRQLLKINLSLPLDTKEEFLLSNIKDTDNLKTHRTAKISLNKAKQQQFNMQIAKKQALNLADQLETKFNLVYTDEKLAFLNQVIIQNQNDETKLILSQNTTNVTRNYQYFSKKIKTDELAVVREKSSYLHLDKFYKLLEINHDHQSQILKARILVWLTITENFDINEIKVAAKNTLIYDDLLTNELNAASSYFYQQDILRAKKCNYLFMTNKAWFETQKEILKRKSLDFYITDFDDFADDLATIRLTFNLVEMESDVLDLIKSDLVGANNKVKKTYREDLLNLHDSLELLKNKREKAQILSLKDLRWILKQFKNICDSYIYYLQINENKHWYKLFQQYLMNYNKFLLLDKQNINPLFKITDNNILMCEYSIDLKYYIKKLLEHKNIKLTTINEYITETRYKLISDYIGKVVNYLSKQAKITLYSDTDLVLNTPVLAENHVNMEDFKKILVLLPTRETAKEYFAEIKDQDISYANFDLYVEGYNGSIEKLLRQSLLSDQFIFIVSEKFLDLLDSEYKFIPDLLILSDDLSKKAQEMLPKLFIKMQNEIGRKKILKTNTNTYINSYTRWVK